MDGAKIGAPGVGDQLGAQSTKIGLSVTFPNDGQRAELLGAGRRDGGQHHGFAAPGVLQARHGRPV
ncbi:MAG TPA: hypothetical protein VJT31_28580 [Rugosimonospora sp.]|nr:hypothetical protein [Rugosimonospora sp.]